MRPQVIKSAVKSKAKKGAKGPALAAANQTAKTQRVSAKATIEKTPSVAPPASQTILSVPTKKFAAQQKSKPAATFTPLTATPRVEARHDIVAAEPLTPRASLAVAREHDQVQESRVAAPVAEKQAIAPHQISASLADDEQED